MTKFVAWLVRWNGKPVGHLCRTEADAKRTIDNLLKYAKGDWSGIEAVPLVVGGEWGLQPFPTAIQALNKIAELPTGTNEDVERGHEEAYRAVEGMFAVPPKVESSRYA